MKNLLNLSLLIIVSGFVPYALGAKHTKRQSASHAEENHAYKDITSKEEFSAEMAKPGVTVIKFYAPWCSFCTKMKPAFEEVARNLKDDANFIAVNTDKAELKDVAGTFKISGLPTTLIIVKKTGCLSEHELEQAVSHATGKAYGMKTTPAPAPADEAAQRPAKKKDGKKKN